ncbi:glycosyltransferase family A protein [Streptomyces sp. NL15-2K]|uniref:glycosyltransferase family A protein n=1 Tax=Streptomyces sp. NL15-2K TaxID=376149 RepID=UPI000F55B822|nr:MULTISPECIES: glycosyltransferase family A protein [Actinomycetes]WKX11827.1 glycosyltransferase family A protein [Kutzneria buriramensis]GCB46687.1 glycosyl transferase [Streptomyces sp. NL15-2K]
MADPTVSVIIAAYNAMPYVTRCITSVAEQSIGQDALQVIVVDDGSTDGTAKELDRLSEVHPGLLTVSHQENSGGPSDPRNKGLDQARGEFVFFLDADDYLGPQALERMVAMAEENGTDIVLGKMIGVGGRGAPKSMFQRDQPKTDVFASRVYWTLNPMKLFRRELLERLGLRFPTDLSIGEDQLFVGPAYFHASGISVLADYDCLYWVEREDSGNITLRNGGTEPRLTFLPRVIDMVLENVPPGPGRDHLAHRHLTVEVQQLLDYLPHESRATQEKALDRLAEIIAPLWHEGMNERLSAMSRLRLHLIRHRMLDEVLELIRFEEDPERLQAAPLLCDNGRAYARYPFLRDPAHAVPDSCYDVTDQLGVRHHITRAELRGTALRLAGHAHLHRVETHDVTTELVLRERDSGTEYRLPVTHTATPGLGADEDGGRFRYENAGFEAEVDITTAADGRPLVDGLWDISLAVGAQSVSREARVGSKRSDAVSPAARTRVVATPGGLRAVTLYTTKPYGNFTLYLGEKKHKVARRLAVDSLRWSASYPTQLVVTGHSGLDAYPDGDLTVVLTNDRDERAVVPAARTPHTDLFTARVDVAELSTGVWTGELRLGDWSVPLPALPERFATAKWRRRGMPRYAKPAPDAGKQRFALLVAKTELVKALVGKVK